MTFRIFTPLLGLLVGSCALSARNEAASLEIFDPELASAFHSYTEAISQPRTPLLFDSDRTVRNCVEYFEERARSEISDAGLNRLAASEYRFCDALDLLRRAHPVAAIRRPSSFYSEAILDRLDLRSFPSSLRPQIADAATPVMRAVAALAPRQHRFSVISDTEDWYYSFEVAARADFNGDGREDWLVFFTDEAKEGTYRDYSVLVLHDALESGLLRVGMQR